MRTLWYIVTISALLVACGHTDTSAGVPFPGNPGSNACTTGTTVALSYPLPGATNVPAGTRTIVIASSPGIRLSNAALVLVPAHGRSNSKLGPRVLLGPVPSPSASPSAPTPFPSTLFYAAKGFHLKRSHTYYVDVAELRSSCTASRISGARFKTAPY